jgi:putative phosphoesterase
VSEAVFVSDVHSNLEALEAVLRDAGAAPLYCLGDMVGYGASPNEVLERLRDAGAVVVRGNHDEAVLSGSAPGFTTRAEIAAMWTARQISKENTAFLSAAPLTLRTEVEGADVFMVHGSPVDPLREYVFPESHENLFDWYLDRTRCDAVSLGHTHVPFVWRGKAGAVFNPGSVGQPRDGDPRASYAVFRKSGSEVNVRINRVKYDVRGAAAKIRSAGLPESLASRLETGT